MNFLALDTSSNACSVAVQAGDRIVNKHVVEARVHTRILMPMISELLEEFQLSVADLDAVILGNGPGSFIGVRIGASVAQGLCFGAGLKIVPISSLAVVAAEVFASSSTNYVAIAQDARMGELYFAQYERGTDGAPELIGSEKIVAADETQIIHMSTVIAGGGWDRHPNSLTGFTGTATKKLTISVPDARFLLPLGVPAYLNGKGIEAGELQPAYLRTKVAEKPSMKRG
ncbi:MAG: tRNA (adenosine(37)-N6)-threonylcarbamoyltransferase complex dimerization subunit type 1 TsaB [Woeseia sp.]|nr:tRNA (adenosine(37)-N6)-threonylcarbamoyltransferase complex dimerization subunit type 1 TsaB [Woeseia sp.]